MRSRLTSSSNPIQAVTPGDLGAYKGNMDIRFVSHQALIYQLLEVLHKFILSTCSVIWLQLGLEIEIALKVQKIDQLSHWQTRCSK